MMSFVRFWAVFALFPIACFAGEASSLTIRQAVDNHGFGSAAISPNGKYVAAIGNSGDLYGLILIDTETHTRKLLQEFNIGRIGFTRFWKEPRKATWVTDDLIAVDYGLVAETIDLEGKTVASTGVAIIGKAEPDNVHSTMLLVYDDLDHQVLARVDGRTGEKDRFDLPFTGKVSDWAFDSRGNLRALTLLKSAFFKDESSISNWYRATPGGKWQKLAEFSVLDEIWTPLRVGDEDGTLLVLSSIGRDTRGVFKYDARSRKMLDMVYGHPTQDLAIVEGLELSQPRVVVTMGLKPERFWLDPQWKKVQLLVDKALPDRINVVSGDPAAKVLVYSYSDVDPGIWLVLDTRTFKMDPLLHRREAIDYTKMRPMEAMRYRARDGLEIPAYLTRPAGVAGKLPTVVVLHGGPAARDHWQWNESVQLLAAHGYLVFQPQFRGSSGFGRAFKRAGKGQWGNAMQDDVTDGVQELIKQGLADPGRICIYGASYGGYAALWGLVKTPELYRCGISFAGVVDISMMMNDSSDSNKNKVVRQLMRDEFGDADKASQNYDAVSPLKNAASIKVPVLLMHGNSDERVPIEHGLKMAEALKKANKTYEWMSFEGEGHGLKRVSSEKMYYQKVIDFLDKQIGRKAVQAGESAGP